MAFWLCAAIAVLIGLLLLVVLSRVRIRIRYSRSGEDDRLVGDVHALYGIYRYHLVIPAFLIQSRHLVYRKQSGYVIAGQHKSNQPEWRRGIGILRRMWRYKPLLREPLKTVECTRFRLDLRVGTGDAPSTAILSGLLWTLYGCAIGLTGQTVALRTKPHGGVEPLYGLQEFSIVWEADFRVRIGAFAWSMLKPGKQWRRFLDLWRSRRNWAKGPQSA